MTDLNANPAARLPTAVDAIAEAWVDVQLELFPEFQVHLGRGGRGGEFTDYSPDGAEQIVDATKSALASIRSAAPVDDVDWVTQLDLSRELQLAIDEHDDGFGERNLNVIVSPPQEMREVFDLSPTDTEADWETIARRLHNLPAAMNGYIQRLRSGIASGNVPALRQVRELIGQAGRQASPTGFFARYAQRPVAATAELGSALLRDIEAGSRECAGAYANLATFLADELAPHAPRRDAVGRDRYALASRHFLGATVDLDETYEWGLDELARTVVEQERVAQQISPGATISEAVALLDGDDGRKLHGTQALKEWMQLNSDHAVTELSKSHFDIPDEVKRLECLIAPTQEGGMYYTGPSDDFSRPGRMWWSVPEGITEFSTWRELTTVFHEGIPGHHLQIGLATHNKATLNTWRRNAGTSGHCEGWGLYAERLMEQLGFLEDPADRFGMLDAQRMRAARVVLDIGVHLQKPRPDGAGRWDFDYALEFLRQNVTMSEPALRFEVNRYFGWPGQAPSYKVGQRIWEQARDDQQKRQGADFNIKAFHTRALSLGGVGLDTLTSALRR
ncbi:DUF885 domain-containing protein [Cryobacterium aureum]|uniref:DUF885 domain-containing protein n=1 Tax=Cryobacterium aureum TaxID=995037 RepID=UPI000CF37959|nr:DUF885 domain-containing protein [Cryobacterium aureum]